MLTSDPSISEVYFNLTEEEMLVQFTFLGSMQILTQTVETGTSFDQNCSVP